MGFGVLGAEWMQGGVHEEFLAHWGGGGRRTQGLAKDPLSLRWPHPSSKSRAPGEKGMESPEREKPSPPLTIPQKHPLPQRCPDEELAFGQSLLCFGVMAMKDSSGVGNAQEEIGRHSKYNLDFVD